ncbi:MAG: PEP-CTERM sorting domain-containing protein [Planctomycetales bacterium]|nr:PEP-CTERM sorting domain-containing protein [Planctomycetales bacterium]
MNRLTIGLLVLALAMTSSGRVDAARVQWPGNGHWYEAVNAEYNLTWFEARNAAIGKGGYLASIGSEAENEFVFSLIDDDEFWVFGQGGYVPAAWGPWLGGYQPTGSAEPDGGWTWVSGDPWDYTNWDRGQPDNNTGAEHYLQFHSIDGVRASTWNDWRVMHVDLGPHAYVVEYVPEPTSLALAALGLMGVACCWRRR